jgi:hypothetical protein
MKLGLPNGGQFLDDLNDCKFVNKVGAARSCFYKQHFLLRASLLNFTVLRTYVLFFFFFFLKKGNTISSLYSETVLIFSFCVTLLFL